MKPLANMRVIEMGSVVLAPYAGQLLAEMGATVIKIEPLAGDSTRSLGHAEHAGMASLFLNCNRGKQSIAIDVRHPEGLAAVERLVASADVFLHNMRFDSAERLGVGYEALSRINPKLVYCATYGYGAQGRSARQPAYDDIIQAGCGVAMLKAAIDGVPAYAPTIIADKTTALFVALGIMGALMQRSLTGEGRQLEVPMLETMTHFVSIEHLNGLTWQTPVAPSGYVRLLNANRRPHKTQDGYLAVMPHSEKQWRKFFTAVGREDVLVDPRFGDAASRSRNIEALYIIVRETMPTRTSAQWAELFTKHDIPFGAVNTLDDLIDDGHLQDVGFWHQVEHPTEGTLRVPSFPVRDGGPQGKPSAAGPAPSLGQHTRELLRAIGYPDEAIEALVEQGVVATCRAESAAA